MFSFFSPPPPWLRPPGGLGRGRGLDPLPKSSGLASLQEHLPGVVCHRARGRPLQRRHHGPVGLRHPALRVRGCAVRGGEDEREGCRWRSGETERELNAWTGLCCGCEEGWFYAAWLQTSFPSSPQFRFYLFLLQKNVSKEHVTPPSFDPLYI